MTEIMKQNIENLRTLQALVVIVTAPMIVGLNSWALVKLVDLSERVGILEDRAGEGSRYTGEDAIADFGRVDDAFRGVYKVLDDHETRIRTLESE